MNQRLISSFADFAPDPVMVFATDGRLESVNTHAANLLGIPRTAVGTLTLVDLLGGQSKAARAVIRQALAQKEPTPIRLTVAAPGREAAELSGECWRIGGIGRAWVGVRFNQTGSAAGIFGELAVTIDELNRQLRAKDRVLKRLAELEAEARRIQAEAKIGSWQWQRGDAKVALSDEAGRLLGLAPGQSSVDIRTYLKRTEQADRRRVAQALQALYRDGGPVEIEHKLRVNEEHRDLRIRGRADERDTSRIFGFVQDMTRRKQFDRMLRHSESRLSSILEAASDAIIVFDETGEILLFNQAAERLYRWTARQAIGDSIFRLIPEELHGSGNIEDLLKVVRRRAGKNLYQRGRRISGEEFPAEVRWSNSEFEGKKYFAVTVRDVSSKKALEEKLRDAQRLDAIGQLTGGVAHDFNNLLTVILGNAEACRAEMALNRQAREHLDLILLAGQKGADLTQRLLSFARQQQLSPRSFDLNGRVREFVKLVSRTVEENIEIGVSLSDGLEPVRADPGELDTALLNLVVNARHAMTQGGKITIETGRAAFDENTASQEPGVMPGHYATVAVSDTGIGMSEDVVRRAFEPFFTTKPQGKGSGLGLSMVFGFAKQSGGHAEIKSAVGRGTTVRLYLPFASTRDKFEADTSEAEAAAPRGGRILVVEDNDFVRQTVTFQLERLGYTVTGAPTAAAALDILRQDAGLDLVLSDMVMPGGLSGADLLREVTEHYPGIKVVLMSGYAGAELRDQIRSIGDAPLLQKPVSSKVLARAIEHVLSA